MATYSRAPRSVPSNLALAMPQLQPSYVPNLPGTTVEPKPYQYHEAVDLFSDLYLRDRYGKRNPEGHLNFTLDAVATDIGLSAKQTARLVDKYDHRQILDFYNPEKRAKAWQSGEPLVLDNTALAYNKFTDTDRTIASYLRSDDFKFDLGSLTTQIAETLPNTPLTVDTLESLAVRQKVNAMPLKSQFEYAAREVISMGLSYKEAKQEYSRAVASLTVQHYNGDLKAAADQLDISERQLRRLAESSPITAQNFENVIMMYVPRKQELTEEQIHSEEQKRSPVRERLKELLDIVKAETQDTKDEINKPSLKVVGIDGNITFVAPNK